MSTLNRSLAKDYVKRLRRAGTLLATPTLSEAVRAQIAGLVDDVITGLTAYLERSTWPAPTVDEPDLETLEIWMIEDGGCEASDGCWVEPDGRCPHGHPSWFVRLGLI